MPIGESRMAHFEPSKVSAPEQHEAELISDQPVPEPCGEKPTHHDNETVPSAERNWIDEERMPVYGWALFLGVPVDARMLERAPGGKKMTRMEFLRLVESVG